MLRKTLVIPLLMVAVLLTAMAPRAASAEGGTPPVPVDAATACQTPGAHPALTTLCPLWSGESLPAAAQAEVAKIIVKLWMSTQTVATTPEEACAIAPPPHAALPVLCALWTGTLSTSAALPGELKPSLGRVILHLVNGKAELAAAKTAREAEAKAAKEAGARKAASEVEARAANAAKAAKAAAAASTKAVDTSYVAKCQAYLAEHPDDQSEKAQYCRKIISGEIVPNAPTSKPREANGVLPTVKP